MTFQVICGRFGLCTRANVKRIRKLTKFVKYFTFTLCTHSSEYLNLLISKSLQCTPPQKMHSPIPEILISSYTNKVNLNRISYSMKYVNLCEIHLVFQIILLTFRRNNLSILILGYTMYPLIIIKQVLQLKIIPWFINLQQVTRITVLLTHALASGRHEEYFNKNLFLL